MNFKMDYSKKQTIQISNDAFYFLYYGEEPLDEENLEEAKEISDMFPHGFYIEDDWKTVDDSDLIQLTIVPYIEDDTDYDAYFDIIDSVSVQIRYIEKSKVSVRWYNKEKCTGEFDEICNIEQTKRGDLYFRTKSGSVLYLSRFTKVKK